MDNRYAAFHSAHLAAMARARAPRKWKSPTIYAQFRPSLLLGWLHLRQWSGDLPQHPLTVPENYLRPELDYYGLDASITVQRSIAGTLLSAIHTKLPPQKKSGSLCRNLASVILQESYPAYLVDSLHILRRRIKGVQATVFSPCIASLTFNPRAYPLSHAGHAFHGGVAWEVARGASFPGASLRFLTRCFRVFHSLNR